MYEKLKRKNMKENANKTNSEKAIHINQKLDILLCVLNNMLYFCFVY